MPWGGGGIANVLGTVTLNRSRVNGNTAQGFVGGGIANGDYRSFSGTSSVLILNGSQVDGNPAPNGGVAASKICCADPKVAVAISAVLNLSGGVHFD